MRPTQRQFIDLTVALDETTPEPFPTKISRIRHGQGVRHLNRAIVYSRKKPLLQNLKHALQYALGTRRFKKDDFPEGEFLSLEKVTASVHAGTHLDAPYHFGSRCEGRPAKTIDQVPLEWCYGSGVVLDLIHKKPGELIVPEDVKSALARVDYSLKPYDIVLIRTGADKLWGTKEYFFQHPAMSREATEWIVGQGVKIIGIDSPGFDRPFGAMIHDYFKTRDPKHLWPAHLFGREKEYCHIERLANLDKIPVPFGFTVACFPIKIAKAGAGWIRPVAIIDG